MIRHGRTGLLFSSPGRIPRTDPLCCTTTTLVAGNWPRRLMTICKTRWADPRPIRAGWQRVFSSRTARIHPAGRWLRQRRRCWPIDRGTPAGNPGQPCAEKPFGKTLSRRGVQIQVSRVLRDPSDQAPGCKEGVGPPDGPRRTPWPVREGRCSDLIAEAEAVRQRLAREAGSLTAGLSRRFPRRAEDRSGPAKGCFRRGELPFLRRGPFSTRLMADQTVARLRSCAPGKRTLASRMPAAFPAAE